MTYRRTTAFIPSAPMSFKPECQQPPRKQTYTGNFVKGIVLLPKQNYCPVVEGTNADPKKGAGL